MQTESRETQTEVSSTSEWLSEIKKNWKLDAYRESKEKEKLTRKEKISVCDFYWKLNLKQAWFGLKRWPIWIAVGIQMNFWSDF